MCKYCDVVFLNQRENLVEQSNTVVDLMTLDEGHSRFSLQLNRYFVTTDNRSENVRTNDLILEQSVRIDNGIYTVQEARIGIKYCPFCGERL